MKVLKKIIFVLICLLTAAALFVASFLLSVVKIYNRSRAPWQVDWDDSTGTIYRDIDSNPEELTGYDLYLPADQNPDRNYSLILYIHGGGFTGGDKSEGENLCKYYTSKGYVCASVNYTVADGAHISDLNLMYDQLHTQVESIKTNAEELGYHITEMATTGESAGGCLAMLYAYRSPEQSPIPVKFVFQMTGPASFEPELWGAVDTESAAGFVTMMSGAAVTSEMIESGAYKEIVDSISPAALVNEATVPTIIAYGPKDKVVPVGLKYILMEAFDQYGVTYDYIEFPHSGHTLALDFDKSQEYADTVEKYLSKYFENNGA
ncbi:MAG: alpha/beta hydrolase fold domain-containing protein [Candidatus Onthomonas sp.]